jgi:hypothetical protein
MRSSEKEANSSGNAARRQRRVPWPAASNQFGVGGPERPTGGFCDANLITLDRDGRAYYQKDAAGTTQPNVVRVFPGRRVRADRSAWQFGVMDEPLSSVVQW